MIARLRAKWTQIMLASSFSRFPLKLPDFDVFVGIEVQRAVAGLRHGAQRIAYADLILTHPIKVPVLFHPRADNLLKGRKVAAGTGPTLA
jgi:hypothetical protein